MFQLAGRSPAEILAVSSSHIGTVLGGDLRRHVRAGDDAMAAPAALRAACPLGATEAPDRRGVVRRAAAGRPCHHDDPAEQQRHAGQRPAAQAYRPAARRRGRGVSDVDRDGYGMLGRLRDPAPLDAGVHPYALDVPGNGIDEDGVGGDLPAGGRRIASGPARPRLGATPDVVLIAARKLPGRRRSAPAVDGRPVTPVLDGAGARRAARRAARLLAQRLHRAVALAPVHRQPGRASAAARR